MAIIDISQIKLNEIEYIDGKGLEAMTKARFNESGGEPLLSYGPVLNSIENRIYNDLPSEDFNLQIRKYFTSNNLYIIKVPNTFKFRPDFLSLILYGSIEYFHIILKINNMKSLLEFIPEEKNNLILVFKPEIINTIIS